MFGHTDEEHRKKPLPRVEWRPITRQNLPPPAPTQPSIDAEGFLQVRRKAMVSVYKEQKAPAQLQNSFDNLTERENPETMHPSAKGEGLSLCRGYIAGA